jgi:hypothetical protein
MSKETCDNGGGGGRECMVSAKKQEATKNDRGGKEAVRRDLGGGRGCAVVAKSDESIAFLKALVFIL